MSSVWYHANTASDVKWDKRITNKKVDSLKIDDKGLSGYVR